METEIIKQVTRVGNSAGVLLPKTWINGKARVQLIVKPLDLKKDLFGILDNYLEDISGIYLVGSYARGEETEKSDVDILIITKRENKKIIKGKYNILLISRDNLEKTISKNAFPLIPMLREAKTIVNNDLLDKYKRAPLTKKNLRWYLKTTKSSIKISGDLIDLSEEEKVSDNLAYSLVLRLRGLYIISSLKKNRIPTKEGLIKLIETLSGSKKAYESYLRSKNDLEHERNLPIKEAKMLLSYLNKNTTIMGKNG